MKYIVSMYLRLDDAVCLCTYINIYMFSVYFSCISYVFFRVDKYNGYRIQCEAIFAFLCLVKKHFFV